MGRGGRRPASSAEQRKRVLRLAEEGRPQREIAEVVFGDARYRGRVERILRRPPARPCPAAAPRYGDPEHRGSEPPSSSELLSLVRELVAQFESKLAAGEVEATLADLQRLLRIRRELATIEELEYLNALTRD